MDDQDDDLSQEWTSRRLHAVFIVNCLLSRHTGRPCRVSRPQQALLVGPCLDARGGHEALWFATPDADQPPERFWGSTWYTALTTAALELLPAPLFGRYVRRCPEVAKRAEEDYARPRSPGAD